ncbi:MAG: glycosyltransferase involved in cell wall biosynthesis [Candidatus Nitrosomirales archaeon]|jgi:glycosyltransferase involved in cell wall biosynthesis
MEKKSVCVLQYGHVYPPSAGTAIRTFSLAKMASKYFRTSVIACLSPREFQFPTMDQEIDGVKIIQKKIDKSTLMDLSKAFNFYYTRYHSHMEEIIRENASDADLIQLEGVNLYSLATKLGKPIVLDMHNVDYELINFVTGWKRTVFGKYWLRKGKRYEINCLRNAKQIIVASERDKNVYLSNEKTLKEKITVIPNCIDTDYYEHVTTDKPIVSTGKPVILFIGSLNYLPNRIAVQDIIRMASKMQDYSFVIVGAHSAIIKNNPENIVFTGFVKDIRPYISAADICIAPLRFGSGTRIKILEYMALKKPVISTSKGVEGLEIDKECLVVEDDYQKFTEIIKDLLTDEKKRKTLAQHAYNEVKRKYDWRNYIDRLRTVYESAMS